MNRFAIRIWFAAALITLGWLSTAWIRSGYSFEVHPLGKSLENIPKVLAGYRGTDNPLDERVREVLNADALVNRQYQRLDGTNMALHISAWSRPDSIGAVALHNPEVCYINAGWKLVEGKTVQVDTPTGTLPMGLLLFEKDQNRCVVAYWYQIGRAVFTTKSEARQIHRDLWGKKQWPATVKVLLQTSARDIEAVLPQIEQFATTVFEWTIDL